MGEKLRYILFVIAFLGSQQFIWTQVTSDNPPEPNTQETTDSVCGTGDGGWPGGIPPPVGRCLPIDDYLLPLFIVGFVLGLYVVMQVNSKQSGAKNSVL